MENFKKRVVCISPQAGARTSEIWVDTETGVNYLYIREGFSGGLTCLVDGNGKPVVSKEYTTR